jgi:DNA-binding protein H-NS
MNQHEPHFSLSELVRQREALDAQIAERQRGEKVTAIASIQSLMREYGVTLRDLGGAKRKVSVGTPKYRDPETGKTWTGRGRRPAWMVNGSFVQIAA